jgi:hypothetical protein
MVKQFIELLIAVGATLGLVVGLIQLYRWYWVGLKNKLKNFLEKKRTIRIKYFKEELQRIEESEYTIKESIKSAFFFCLGVSLLIVGMITGFTGSCELGLPLFMANLPIAQYGFGNPNILMITVGSMLAGVGMGFMFISVFILGVLGNRSRRIQKLRQKISGNSSTA